MTIDKLVYKMLTTNTGIHMLDSGGGENRGWQRNIKRSLQDFENDPVVSWDVDNCELSNEIDYTVSLYRYMVYGFNLDELCQKYNKRPQPNWDSDIYGVSSASQKWLEGQGFEVGRSFNTYNEDCPLSQILQGTYLKFGVDDYVLLQVHNGCDARGGYTDAKLFKLADEWMPRWDVYGSIDGVEVSTSYNGYSLTDDDGNGVVVNKDSRIELRLADY